MKRKNDQDAPLPPAKKAKVAHAPKSTEPAPSVEIRSVAATIDDCWSYLEKEKVFRLDPSLESLKLNGDVFDLKQASILEKAISSTSFLKEVNFSGGYLGKGLPGIVKSLRNQLNLHTLNLEGNNLRDDGAKLVFDFLKENKTLTYLNLGDNGLTLNEDWVMDPIVTSNLKTLCLYENNIDEGEAYIAKALAASTTLQELYLGYNKFESAVMISGALATNKSLKVLSLSGIKMLDFGVRHLVTGLLQNESLVGVNLWDTKLGYGGVIALMNVVKTKKNIRCINIGANPISRDVITSFHDILTQRRKLQELNEGLAEETAALDKRLYESWMKPEDGNSNNNEVEILDKPTDGNNNNNQLEPKLEKAAEEVDFTKLDIFLLDDIWDKPEAINFVEKYPEISAENVVPSPFGLHEMDVLYNSFYKVLGQSLKKLGEKAHQASNETKELLVPIEQMQQTRRNLELERTLLNQKIEKLDKEIKNKAEGYLFKEVDAIKLNDRHAEALKNFENTKTTKSTWNAAYKTWKEKLKQNISTWTVEDVITFLDEIEVWGRGPTFEENHITGAVLLNLTTEELMRDLKMNFHSAKRLQLFILMQQSGYNIYGKLPPVIDWENEQVCRWLRENNLAAHEGAFKKHKITGIELYLLDKSDLATTLQIAALGDRSQIMVAVEALRRENNPFGAKDKVPVAEAIVREIRKEPPSVLICPLTKKLMTDPVQANDGHTYERSAIEAWFKTSKLSPVTNKPLRSVKVIPSHALKAMLEEYNKNK